MRPDAPAACPSCQTELSPTALFCPACQALVHAERLRGLNTRAEAAKDRGELAEARNAWREALDLVPSGSRQHEALRERVAAMTDALGGSASGAAPRPAPSSRGGAIGAGLTAMALLAWNAKTVLLLLGTKGKFLLLGLTKAKTLVSMAAFLAVYWALFGWWFAAGIVASIYVHEIGHVAALAGLGIRASAPMFIPGLGAVVRMDQYPASPIEDARVGLAGPVWGLGAAVVCLGIYGATGSALFMALARVGAWINLFNLIPIWQLDGSRGFAALDRMQRAGVVAVAVALGVGIGDPFLWVIAAVGAWRVWQGPWPAQGHVRTLVVYLALLVTLASFLLLQVPGIAV